jgi:hypothetical protein
MAIAAQAYSSFFLFFSERLLLELPFESNPKHWLLGSFSFNYTILNSPFYSHNTNTKPFLNTQSELRSLCCTYYSALLGFYSTTFNHSFISSPVDVCLAVSALSTNLLNLISLGYILYILVVVEPVSISRVNQRSGN